MSPLVESFSLLLSATGIVAALLLTGGRPQLREAPRVVRQKGRK